jgi:hypothetical protein
MGSYDHDGSCLVLYDGRLYTGYVIFDKYPNGTTEAEIEYDCGSRIDGRMSTMRPEFLPIHVIPWGRLPRRCMSMMIRETC